MRLSAQRGRDVLGRTNVVAGLPRACVWAVEDGHEKPKVENLASLAKEQRPHIRRRLAWVTLAIFSGRDRADLQRRVSIPSATYVGNHGLQISGPGFRFAEPTAAAQGRTLQKLAAALSERLRAIEGVVVELRGLTVVVHCS